MTKEKTRDVIYQEWLESESGWGQRPDGFSLHLTNADCKKYIENYWKSMPDRGPRGEVPDVYSRPVDDPTIRSVPEKAYRELAANRKKGRLGIREFVSFEAWLSELKTR